MKKTIITAWILVAVNYSLIWFSVFLPNYFGWSYQNQAEQMVLCISLIAAFLLTIISFLEKADRNKGL